MAHTPTNWSNNIAKAPTSFTAVPKNKAIWTSDIVKTPAVFTPVTKSSSNWGVNYQPAQTYFYNDPVMTYNDPAIEYNNLLNENQINQRNMTRWDNQ